MTFVLVHPAWFGGWCWAKVAALLRDAGHAVFTPTLTGLGERAHLARPDVGLGTHVEDIANTLVFEELDEVILVGHSSGGMVITGVADRVPTRLSRLIYLDAFVPDDGQSLFAMIPPERRPAMDELVASEGDGWMLPRYSAAPWERFVADAWRVTDGADLGWILPRLRPTPVRHFTEPVQRRNATAERLPRVYIRCPEWPNPAFDRSAALARTLPGWASHELASSHLPFVTHPRDLADILLDP